MIDDVEKLDGPTRGDGLSLICIIPADSSSACYQARQLAKGFSSGLLIRDQVRSVDFAHYLSDLCQSLRESGFKRAIVISWEDAVPLALALALRDKKLVRRLLLVDPVCQKKQRLFEHLLMRLESGLPLGLPFRKRQVEFDPRSSLHMVWCPTLIVESESAGLTSYHREQIGFIGSRLPSSWQVRVDTSDIDAVSKIASVFVDIPTRRSQKR